MKKIVCLFACLSVFSMNAMGDDTFDKNKVLFYILSMKKTSTDSLDTLVDCPVKSPVPTKDSFAVCPVKSPVRSQACPVGSPRQRGLSLLDDEDYVVVGIVATYTK